MTTPNTRPTEAQIANFKASALNARGKAITEETITTQRVEDMLDSLVVGRDTEPIDFWDTWIGQMDDETECGLRFKDVYSHGETAIPSGRYDGVIIGFEWVDWEHEFHTNFEAVPMFALLIKCDGRAALATGYCPTQHHAAAMTGMVGQPLNVFINKTDINGLPVNQVVSAWLVDNEEEMNDGPLCQTD